MASRLGAPWVGAAAAAGLVYAVGMAGAAGVAGAAGAGDVALGRGGKLGGKTGWATLRLLCFFQDRPDSSTGKALLKISRRISAAHRW